MVKGVMLHQKTSFLAVPKTAFCMIMMIADARTENPCKKQPKGKLNPIQRAKTAFQSPFNNFPTAVHIGIISFSIFLCVDATAADS